MDRNLVADELTAFLIADEAQPFQDRGGFIERSRDEEVDIGRGTDNP